MFNMDGEVIGIASFILSESGGFQGLGVYCHVEHREKAAARTKSLLVRDGRIHDRR